MIQNFGIEFLYDESFLQVYRMKHKLSPVYQIRLDENVFENCWNDDSTVTNIEADVIFFFNNKVK